jgi:opacity protein-like surface antigen
VAARPDAAQEVSMRNFSDSVRAFGVLCVLLVGAAWASAASAKDAATTELEAEVEELERRLDIVTDELRKLKEEKAVPEGGALEGKHGHEPAGAKVYSVARGLSLGGYGEFNYKESLSDGNDTYDFVRLVLYAGYKFTDRIIFNSEIEFEHASTGENDEDGEVSVEQAHLDFLVKDWANIRAGLLLIPVGFINELHEPPFFHGNERPSVERQIIPSTWRANGVGFFGDVGDAISYRTYVVTSLRAERFSSSNLRDGRQNGNKEKAKDFSWVGRVDYTPMPGLDLGASIYLGNQGQGDDLALGATTEEVDAFMQMYEGHLQWHHRGLEVRALGVYVNLDDAEELSINAGEPVGQEMWGAYGEVAYDVMPWFLSDTDQYLAPWLRYSRFNTQADVPSGFSADDAQDREDVEVGISYKPIPRVVVKMEYRYLEAEEGSRPDEFRLGAGFVF